MLVCALLHTDASLHTDGQHLSSLTTDATYEPPTALRRRYLLSSCLLKCRVNVYPVGAARKLYALLLEFDRDITFSNLLSFLFFFLLFFFFFLFFTRVPVSHLNFSTLVYDLFALSLSLSPFSQSREVEVVDRISFIEFPVKNNRFQTHLVGVPSVPLSWKMFSSWQGLQILRKFYRISI